jgi:hypothetical protein
MAVYISYIIDLFNTIYNYFWNSIPINVNKHIKNKNINPKYVCLGKNISNNLINHIAITDFAENNIIYGYDNFVDAKCFFISLLITDIEDISNETKLISNKVEPYIITLYDVPNNTIIYSNHYIFNKIETSEKIKIFYNLINLPEYEITYLDDQKDVIKHNIFKLYGNNNDIDEYVLL